MAVTEEQAKDIQNEFMEDYCFTPPYDRYINQVMNVKLKTIEDQEIKFDLRDDESLDDLCLYIGFGELPPEDVIFPSDYKGMRVFYEGDCSQAAFD